MRRLLALAVSLCGCFGEPPAIDPCPPGQPGCFCDDGSCVAGSQCMVSLGRCIPDDCTAGTHTCVCTPEGTCDGDLVCEGGVCLEPDMTSATGDSQASNASVTQGPTESPTSASSVTTDVSDTEPSTTDAPPTTGTSIQPTSAETGFPMTTSPVTTDAPPMGCPGCLESAWASATCQDEVNACLSTDACTSIYDCFVGGGDDCCGTDPSVQTIWKSFVTCAGPWCTELGCDTDSISCG